MKEMIMIIRPEKLETVKDILKEFNCGGMTISTVMGCGEQKGFADTVNTIKGAKTNINLLPKVEVSAVMHNDKIEPVLLRIREELASDHIGDGKVFIRPVDTAIRIRTGERGEKAV